MTSHPERGSTGETRKAQEKPTRGKPPRLVAGAFVAVFALSVGTVIYTGLMVEAPRTELSAGLPVVGMSVAQPRVVNLVFTSAVPLDDVTLLVILPAGIELSGYPGQSQMEWRTELAEGKNVLPLELVAHTAGGGQLAARLAHGEQAKLFRVHLEVGAE